MLDVVLNLKDLPVTEFSAKLRGLLAAANARPEFAPLTSLFDDLKTKLALLDEEEKKLRAAEHAVSAQTVVRDRRRSDVEAGLRSLSHGLGQQATGEESIVQIGARVRDRPRPRPVPGVPADLLLFPGGQEGVLTGRCRTQGRLVDAYEIQYTESDPNQETTVWIFAATSIRRTFELTNLPSGKMVWIRVRAMNTTGRSPWCDPACKRVP